MHFMNPVPVMQLVELIRGMATSDESFETAHAIVQKLGKTAAVSEDYPAFIVNRILLPMINEAAFALYEGVGTVASIDEAMHWAPITAWGCNWLISSALTCAAIMRVLQDGWVMTNIVPVRFWSNMSKPVGWVAKRARSMIMVAISRADALIVQIIIQ